MSEPSAWKTPPPDQLRPRACQHCGVSWVGAVGDICWCCPREGIDAGYNLFAPVGGLSA